MKVRDALKASHPVYVGITASSVRRKDRRGRVWHLISARGNLFLVKPDKSNYLKVSMDMADRWEDWIPQTAHDAQRESSYMNGPKGLALRNALMGVVLGPLPGPMTPPDLLPEDVEIMR